MKPRGRRRWVTKDSESTCVVMLVHRGVSKMGLVFITVIPRPGPAPLTEGHVHGIHWRPS